MKDEYDVIIVGGGMAGASLACALAGMGLRLAVIEAVPWRSDEQPSYDVRTISLSHGSRLIYEALGIWSRIDSHAVCPIHQIHVSDRGYPGIAHLDRTDADVEALGYVIENRALGAALMTQLEVAKDVDIISPATVSEVEISDDFATLFCATDKKEMVIQGKLVVLADGGRSGLREKLGFQSSIDDYQQTAIVCNVTPGKDHQHCAYERFTPSGPLAMLPMNENRCWCVWAVAEEDVEELTTITDDEFLQRLQRQFGDRLGRFSRAGKRYAYPLARSRVTAHTGNRVALVGNAAHIVHPVAAQGFNLALRDVAWLAEVLAKENAKQNDPGSSATLQQYEQLRSKDAQRVTAFTHDMINIFTSRLAPVVAGRNLALLATDMFPELKQALLKRTMGLAGRQSRLARGLGLRQGKGKVA